MKLGLCTGPDMADAAKNAGYSFIEMNVAGRLCPLADDAAFADASTQVDASALPCPVCNCFVPGDLKITGPDADMEKLTAYVATVCQRANAAGVEVIVFGSGGARNVPDGFDRDEAWKQLVAFSTMVAKEAEKQNITVVLEPLNTKECNVINSVAEGAKLVREVNLPHFRLLVDAYHWALENEPVESIVDNGDLLAHVHVATRDNRIFPGAEPFDFAPFVQALKNAGYDGRISVEASVRDAETDLPRAAALLTELWNG